jgi:hypothetical protein
VINRINIAFADPDSDATFGTIEALGQAYYRQMKFKSTQLKWLSTNAGNNYSPQEKKPMTVILTWVRVVMKFLFK